MCLLSFFWYTIPMNDQPTKQRGIFPTIIIFAVVVLVIGFVANYFWNRTPAAPTNVAITVPVKFDQRKWNLAYQNADKTISVAEYVPEGQTIDNWKELLTVQAFPHSDTNASPETLATAVKISIQQQCPKQFADLGTVKAGDQVFYEWFVKGCAKVSDQHEIARILTSGNSYYSIHYAVRQSALTNAERAKWVALIGSVALPQ